MQVSIQRKSGDDKGIYQVLGFIGGGVVILDKDKQFQHVGFGDIPNDWDIVVDADKKDTDKKSTADLDPNKDLNAGVDKSADKS